MIGDKKASPGPSEPTVTDRREVKEGSASSQVFCRKLSDKEPCPPLIPRVRIGTPLLSEGSGGRLGEAWWGFSYYTYLSVKQIVTKAFAELVTPVPRKTIVFRIKLLTFANRKEKPHQQPHPTSPREEECRSRDYPKKFQKLVLVCLEISVLRVKRLALVNSKINLSKVRN